MMIRDCEVHSEGVSTFLYSVIVNASGSRLETAFVDLTGKAATTPAATTTQQQHQHDSTTKRNNNHININNNNNNNNHNNNNNNNNNKCRTFRTPTSQIK